VCKFKAVFQTKGKLANYVATLACEPVMPAI